MNFGFRFNLDHVIISPSTGSATAGQTDYSLTCSSTLFEPSRLSITSDVPSPNFQWSLNGGASLPSGVTAMPTVISSSNSTSETYSSTLQFSSISQCHIGMYTCRLGAARLVNSAMVAVDGIATYTCMHCCMVDIDLSFSFQRLPFHPLMSLSRSSLMEIRWWDKVATTSHVV